jgi:serine/threonine-protein kinase
MGSPFYMSPEQVQSAKDVDTRTDLWALGVILFELLTGTVPFPGEAFGEIAVKIAMQETPPLRSYRPDAPPGLEAVIRTSLEKDRKRRFPNVAELAVALAPFAPPRAGATVERIRGIIEAAGLSVSPSAPPSAAQVRQKTLLAQESVAPWSDTLGPVRSRRAVVWSVGIVGIVVAGAIAARSISQPPVIHSASALASVQPPPVAVTIDAALPSPTENRTPEHLAPLPTTTATLSAPPPAREETPPPRVPAAATLRSAPTAHVTSPLSAPTVTVLAPPTAPRPPPTAPPSARPNCDPPFTLDEQGQRHYKPECYLGK